MKNKKAEESTSLITHSELVATKTEVAASEIVPVSEVLPPNLVLVPVSQTTLFPGMIVPLILPEGKLTKTAEFVTQGPGFLGIVLYKQGPCEQPTATGPTTSMTGLPPEETPEAPGGKKDNIEFHPYGVAARVLKKINLPDNQVSVLVTGLQRFGIEKLLSHEPHLTASVRYILEETTRDSEMEALLRTALSQFKALSKDNPLISEEIKVALVNIDGPGKLADLIASILIRDISDYQHLLSLADVKQRLQHLLVLLKRELDVQSIQKKIHDEINQKVASSQREYYLQEQLKLIQKELGRSVDEKSRIIQKFLDRLKNKTLPKEPKDKIEEETQRLQILHEQSSEFGVCINYLDWLTAIPWGVRTKEFHKLKSARKILEEDHFGLKDVKERILEFLAVRQLKKESEGTILCFVGPPGTGKTSLGRSIARALNRKFFRFSVGGMRDEAEIKGHRRTYVGAMPGKLIQGLKRVGAQNPVFLVDEVDKIASARLTGSDPAAALLEMFDPEQHKEFLDHYLDVPFDCSEVFFIATANSTDTIPSALLDRMEVIYLSGYTDHEKHEIALRHLLPKQLKKHALVPANLAISDEALKHMTTHYAREAGVRNLEKCIAKLCRKTAMRLAMGKKERLEVDSPATTEKLLGLPPFAPDSVFRTAQVGVITGLAWTQSGGEVLNVESLAVPGKGGYVLTGQLGDVMQESANIAYTFIRDRAQRLPVPKNYFEKHQLHLHVPAGATPKDGPSAGITMAASLHSLISGKKPRQGVAMTGELTLTGRVLPVGGIKEKLLAAKRSNIGTVILPKENQKDLKEIDNEVLKGIRLIKVDNMSQCLKYLFHSS
jgi:ATP-dependent Lon protease